MRPGQLIASKRPEQQCRDRLDPPPQQADQIERRPVGPVQILEHDDARSTAAQLPHQRLQQLADPGAGVQQLRHVSPSLLGDVDERAERAGRVQGVARSRRGP